MVWRKARAASLASWTYGGRVFLGFGAGVIVVGKAVIDVGKTVAVVLVGMGSGMEIVDSSSGLGTGYSPLLESVLLDDFATSGFGAGNSGFPDFDSSFPA